MTIIHNAEEAAKNAEYKDVVIQLLYQLADDDFIVAFRGSEWLGLAPHIEADVAYSSITQNTMVHAAYFYQLLEELGQGPKNKLAHERSANERRNATYLEKKNGDGVYDQDPYYDWALAVIRGFFYETFKRVRLQMLKNCSYVPLTHAANRMLAEQTYHLAYWKMWVNQLQSSSATAKQKLDTRIQEAWNECLDLLQLGDQQEKMIVYQLMPEESLIEKQWIHELSKTLVQVPDRPLQKVFSGRIGEHTKDLEQAIDTLSEVYRLEEHAVW
ncbi:LOW QUALITY PROTEIN: phenylacetate-CoA oxygenase, PaaI subunit [Geomicrobium sp. JCM 19037]|nr:LOW QUALITY PROTEIN: phenylacetate-CoA oxygenase, PaaI subunit [Geomicrobium sp. JCM 19037]